MARTAGRRLRRARGLTLPELTMAMALAALLAGAALPSMRTLLDRMRVRAAVADFQSALQAARSEAIRRGARVDLVPMRRQDWASGWLVLQDLNRNQQADPGEPVLHSVAAPAAGLQVSASLRDARGAYLSFGPEGRPRSLASGDLPQVGSLTFSSGGQRRKLVIGFLGRLRSCDPDRDGAAC